MKTEGWRNVQKVGTLLGDAEHITRRKRLAIIHMNTYFQEAMDKISKKRRLKSYNAIIKTVLT